MKTTKLTMEQVLEKYRIWLGGQIKVNGELFQSVDTYINYLKYAVRDLSFSNPRQFYYIGESSYLRRLTDSLTSSGAFKNRTNKLQNDMICGYNKYVEFVSATF